MVVVAKRLPFESLVRTAEQLSAGVDLPTVLELLAAAAAEATGAEIAIVRVLDEASGLLVARAVAPGGSAQAAELSGSRVAPGSTRPGSFVAPAFADGSVIGEIELVGSAATASTRPPAGSPSSRRRSSRSPCGRCRGRSRCGPRRPTGGHALRSSSARAARSPPAPSSSAPRGGPCSSPPRPWAPPPLRSGSASTSGSSSSPRWGPGRRRSSSRRAARPGARSESWEPALVEDADDGDGVLVSIRIGQPPAGVLQLRCTEPPVAEELVALSTFAGRVGHAVSLGERAQELEVRARADTRPALGGRRRDHPPLARAHARDGGRADRRAARDRAGRDLPPRGPPARRGADAGSSTGTRRSRRRCSSSRSARCGRARRSRCAGGSADPMLAPCEAALAAAGVEGGARGAAARPRRDDRAARRLPGPPAARPRATARCSRPSPASSPSPSRTRGCTSRRRSSATRSGRCSRRSARRRDGCGRSTRSRARSRAASPSTRRSRRSRRRSSRCSASTRP